MPLSIPVAVLAGHALYTLPCKIAKCLRAMTCICPTSCSRRSAGGSLIAKGVVYLFKGRDSWTIMSIISVGLRNGNLRSNVCWRPFSTPDDEAYAGDLCALLQTTRWA